MVCFFSLVVTICGLGVQLGHIERGPVASGMRAFGKVHQEIPGCFGLAWHGICIQISPPKSGLAC